jgi:YgiT-type zinc finger domain-containing protein
MEKNGIPIIKQGGTIMKCKICSAELKKSKVNHIIDLDDHIIIIKEVPALVCEQCGEYFLETDIALKIEKMVETVYQNHAEVFIVKFNELVA